MAHDCLANEDIVDADAILQRWLAALLGKNSPERHAGRAPVRSDLVLSLFPGIGLLDMAFEQEGYCVVRGPDVLWGGDVRRFHPPAGRFQGVIGGPPCQLWSKMRFIQPNCGAEFGDLIPEYERIVAEGQPDWFIMENVEDAPLPTVEGYRVHAQIVRDKWVGGVTPRPRRISFGTRTGQFLEIEWALLMKPMAGVSVLADHGPAPHQREHSILGDGRAVPVKLLKGGAPKRSVLSSGVGVHGGGRADGFEGGYLPGAGQQSIEEACVAQGLPADFTDHMPFTMHGKRSVIGNGVPLPMGRAVARAVRAATGAGEAG